jgi:Flp pilus assembly pilin Flp
MRQALGLVAKDLRRMFRYRTVGISLRNEKGQAIVEYVLVLVVAVTIILGGVYQLNSAFKSWANNYFGNYLSCLLETGELPTISGTGGDSGLCNQLFKPFSLADGRPLVTKGQFASSSSSPNTGGGTRETPSGTRTGGGGGGASSSPHSSFSSARHSPSKGAAGSGPGKNGKMSASYTGDTSASGYAGGYSSNRGRSSSSSRTRLDQGFAFDETREKEQRRSLASSTAKPSTDKKKEGRAGLNSKSKNKNTPTPGDEEGFSFGDFIRWLIIAAILIAILLFLGGQGLQISKSME